VTLAELLVAMTITVSVMGGVVGLVQSARATFQALPESADMEQRVRAGVDALARDLIMAGAGSKHGSADPCNDDVSLWPDHGSAISIVYVPRAQTTPVTHTYYLDTDPTTHISELTREDESLTKIPVVDHVVSLQFAYFAGDSVPLDVSAFEDGPWCGTAPAPPHDADLTTIRRVHVALRIEAVLDSMRGPAGPLFTRGGTSTRPDRLLPDRELEFDVSPRNLNVDR
jgi:hypothetical protein